MNWADSAELAKWLGGVAAGEIQPHMHTGAIENRYIVYRMLQALYARQTADEQAMETTKHKNGMGFNGVDAAVLSDIAAKSQQYGNLTVKQAAFVAKKLRKYSAQLAAVQAAKQNGKNS